MNNRKQTIETWMLEIVRDGGVERFDDLHIDRIDPDWKPKERWIEGALAAHQIALHLRNRHGFPVTVAAAFSLKAENRRVGVDFHTLQELEARLDWTPPSLYLFWRGKEPWASSDSFHELRSPVAGDQRQALTWLYTEFNSGTSDEYCRTVFCES